MNERLSHHDDFIQRITLKLIEALQYQGPLSVVYVRRPSKAENEEVILRIQYRHPSDGASSDELILLRDGTWRYIPG
jgi:hypothetical protein